MIIPVEEIMRGMLTGLRIDVVTQAVARSPGDRPLPWRPRVAGPAAATLITAPAGLMPRLSQGNERGLGFGLDEACHVMGAVFWHAL